MKFDINNYKGKYVMHCKTEKEAEDFCTYLHGIGKRWFAGNSYLELTHWETYHEDTCYNFNDDFYCDIDYYKRYHYKILEWSDFMNGTFTKSDLKDGMVIEHRDGDRYIVLGDFALSEEGNWCLKDYFEDLKWDGPSDMDIVKIYKVNTSEYMDFSDVFNDHYLKLIWERKEEPKPTPKYKPGDKVRVRSDLIASSAYGGIGFIHAMTEFIGKTVTIASTRTTMFWRPVLFC